MTNLSAFLDTIAHSEGTYGVGQNGYNVLFGSTPNHPKLFTSYADHPRIRTYETHDNFIKNGKLDFTSASGRYQIIKGMYDEYKRRLGLPDFSPASQDAIATEMIREALALGHIEAGRFERAVELCARIWASFPKGCGDQHKNTMTSLRSFYLSRGGLLEGMTNDPTTV